MHAVRETEVLLHSGVDMCRSLFSLSVSAICLQLCRLSDCRDNLQDIVDTLSDKVSDAKGNADDLHLKIQDVKYEERNKIETVCIWY
jgi:hypothetical protein